MRVDDLEPKYRVTILTTEKWTDDLVLL